VDTRTPVFYDIDTIKSESDAMTEIRCVVAAGAQLGEGTFWDVAGQALWWVDIFGKTIHRYIPASDRQDSYPTPEEPGCLATRAAGGLVLSMTSGFYFWDPQSGRFDSIVDPESELPATRFNDGRTDRQGRFWSGSMVIDAKQEPRKIASLYCLEANRTHRRVLENIGCANGLAWSPDSRTMYHSDSHTSLIRAWDFDPVTAEIDNARTFVDLDSIKGIADGATVDAEGCYWVTIPFQGKVMRFDPDGKLMRTVELPCDLPTCCEFGGADLDVLYVTTARLDRTTEVLAKQGQPLAGGLFALDVGVRGLPATPFAG
jgi:sugar lactone lactonase YvrE